MNRKQECKLSMYLVVRDFLTANNALLSPLPNYTAFFTALGQHIVQIQAFSLQLSYKKTGVSDNKTLLRENLIKLCLENSRRLTAFAGITNNPVLLAEIKTTKTELLAVADTTLYDTAAGIHAKGQANLAALATYGITAATQTAFMAAITTYGNAIPKTRIAIADKRSTNQQLAVAFENADRALNGIDLLIEMLRDSQAAFYANYRSTRKVVYTGNSPLQLKGTVNDGSSQTPVVGATVIFEAVGVPKPQLNAAAATLSGRATKKRSAGKGGFLVKSLPEGEYLVTVSKTGFVTQQVRVFVSASERTNLTITLMRVL